VNLAAGGNGVATALAIANGLSGTSQAQAFADGGAITALQVDASAPVAETFTRTEASGSISGAVSFSPLSGLQAVARATGLPSVADAHNALFGNPNSEAAFDFAGFDNPLGLLAFGGEYTGTAGSRTYTSSVALSIDLTTFIPGKFKIALLDPETLGTGFDLLSFTIVKEGGTLFTQNFATVALADAFFDDNVLDYGTITTGVTGTLDLTFTFSLTTDDPGAGYNANLILGNAEVVPEPSAAVLLLLGLGWAGAQRRRSRK
jgi:hypothetical protein